MTTESLTDRIERLKESTNKFNYDQTKSEKTSSVGRLSSDVVSVQKFGWQLSLGFFWIWWNLIRPCVKWAIPPCNWLLKKYIHFWNKHVYVKDVYDIPVFSKVRAGIMIILTAGFLYYLLVPFIETTFESGLYVATARVNETVYLLGSQEIDSETGMHAVEGCSHLPCNDSDAIYYRTRSSIFNNLWSLSHGKGFFYPEYVAAAIPYNVSKCSITSYGVRIRFFMKGLNIFPSLLSSSCQPVKGEEK